MRIRRPFLDPEGAVVVITGASSGIGRLTAHRLARRGAKLVLAARGAEALDAVAAECAAAGAEAVPAPTDVSDPAAVEALARLAEERFGHIDAWINNAGVMAYGRFDDVPLESHRQVLATNLLGVVHGCHAALRRFDRQDHGLLVNVSSLLGVMTVPWVSSYVTSKFGVVGLSKVLHRDYRSRSGIAVSCILPSSMDTPIFRTAANHLGHPARAIPPVADPDRVARAIERCFQRPRREVRVGYLGRIGALGERLLPPVYDRIAEPAYRFAAFGREQADPTDGNLFAPVDDWQQVRGEWRNTTARRVAVGVAAAAATTTAALAARRAAA